MGHMVCPRCHYCMSCQNNTRHEPVGFETACWTESRWFSELQWQSADLESLFVKVFKPLNVYFPVFWKTSSTRRTRRSWRLIRRWRTSWLIVMHINDFHRIWFQVERPQLVRWKYVLSEKITILYNSSEILTSKQRPDFSWKWTPTSCVVWDEYIVFLFYQYGNVF